MNEDEILELPMPIEIPELDVKPEKPVKVKKKPKGYFDNEHMISLMKEKKALKECLALPFYIEDIDGSVTSILNVTLVHGGEFIIFNGDRLNISQIEKKYESINNQVGRLYMKVADGMMKRPNFINYPPEQKSEMISDALYFMTRAGERYDVNYPNPFAYFSQITFHSFLQSIKNMKKRISTFVCVDHLENFDGYSSDYVGDE